MQCHCFGISWCIIQPWIWWSLALGNRPTISIPTCTNGVDTINRACKEAPVGLFGFVRWHSGQAWQYLCMCAWTPGQQQLCRTCLRVFSMPKWCAMETLWVRQRTKDLNWLAVAKVPDILLSQDLGDVEAHPSQQRKPPGQACPLFHSEIELFFYRHTWRLALCTSHCHCVNWVRGMSNLRSLACTALALIVPDVCDRNSCVKRGLSIHSNTW